MEGNNCCAECGFTTTDMRLFTNHIEEHEEDQKAFIKSEVGMEDELCLSPRTESPDEEKREEKPKTGLLSSDEEKMLCTASSSSGSVSPNEGEASSLSPSLRLTSPKILSETSAAVKISTDGSPIKPNKAYHVCPHCNFRTYMSQHMKSHLEAHERHQGQMYQCDICQMQFSQKANMHRHRMRHSGIKPYECRYCKKRFFRKDQMQEHSMTHIKTGADFDCPVAACPMQFSQHSALRAHLDDSHTIGSSTPASCKRCSLLFANSRRLLLHYQTKHDEGDTSNVSTVPYVEKSHSPEGTPTKKRRTTISSSSIASNHSVTNLLASATTKSTPSTPPAQPASVITSLAWQQATAPAAAALPSSSAVSLPTTSSAASQLALLQSQLESMVKQELSSPLTAPPASAAPKPAASSIVPATSQPSASSTDADSCDHSASPDYDHITPYQYTSEDLLMLLSNSAVSSFFNMDALAAEAKDVAMRSVWPANEPMAPSFSAQHSHSPSVDSGDSAIDREEDSSKESTECTFCGMLFFDKTMYLLHKGLHSDSDPWKCNLCGHNCGDKYVFTTHIISRDHSA